MSDMNDVVVDPSVVLKETASNLKALMAAEHVPKHIAKAATKEIAELERNYSSMIDDDFDTTHTNVKSLIDKGMQTLNTLLAVAAASDHAGTYEVAAIFLKTLSDLNKDLLEIHDMHDTIKKKRDNAATGPSGEGGTINQNLFIGTPMELLELMKAGKEAQMKLVN